jgi:hypothetical protein
MVQTQNMEWQVGYSFTVGEEGIPSCAITIDLEGNITCMMFSERYRNRREPIEWLVSVVAQMKSLYNQGFHKVKMLSAQMDNREVNILFQNSGFIRIGDKWIYNLE